MTGSSLPLAGVPTSWRGRGVIARLLAASLAVFVLDGLYVVIVFTVLLHRATADKIFQGIASALVGPSALGGGWGMTALGVLLHFSVALGWSAVWTFAYERSARLRRAVASTGRALLVGAAYGVLVWLAMQLVVLPLTFATRGPMLTRSAMLVLLAHVLVVGPPIVLLVRQRARSVPRPDLPRAWR